MEMVLESPDYQVTLTAIAVLLILLSYVLVFIQRKAIRNQRFFIGDESELQPNKLTRGVLGQLSFAAIVFAFAWALGSVHFDFFAGGYVVSSLIGLMFVLHNILYFRGLGDPGAGSGKIEFSPTFRYKSLGYRLLAAGALVLCFFGLLGQIQFLGASLFLLGTGVGYLLRAKRLAAA